MKKREDITHSTLKRMVLIEGKKQREVAKYFGVSEACISKKMKEFGIRKDIRDRYVGKTFGDLIPIHLVGYDDKSHAVFRCVCVCGKEIDVRNHCLSTGNTKSCGCTSRKRGKDHEHYRGYKDIRHSYWGRVIREAKKRNLEFDITIEYAWDLFVKQGKRCSISGQPIHFAITNKSKQRATASLDRIDPSKGYIEGNVQWLHKKVNQMKWDLQQKEFIDMCRLITNYQGLN
jgi:hypothetical protein